jgi:hypothetical protein
MFIDALERDLPPALLLLGPEPGPMLSAAFRAVMKTHLALQADLLIRRHLSAGDARHAVKFAQTAPFGPVKIVIIGLDGSTPQAQNILLKVLEEPPDPIRFILVASERPLPTIVSRCQVVTVPEQGGQPEPDGKVTGQVNAAMQAALAADLNGLDQALRGWGDAHHAVLSVLLAEQAVAEPGQQDPLAPARARRLLGALGRHAGAHPRLAAHAALVSVLSDREQHA